ncbi:hypothetical protein G6F57_009267 [Rhizopus arrhizus]|uniref:Uncharacterized protein n=1 Tax=Rhizopus oryzae TaxID=64495 RepID=A0A9P6X3L8_RHIOR|nr:hypothetical protein G6F24_009129 [Rhizopus arrhizus]KAG1414634.1 hypothetical protein G6F58_006855 [Rhizopus delemar]KAG0785437.1 hypothetical protein G6F21_009259 [Rhizopus arrhizus]KAG0808195.1 hypothetical protein G6F20_009779 [Rhizopus arrhizus]KAG0825790.1 hypothetical protein G6F19_009639 [Rhizopus arrhizus]
MIDSPIATDSITNKQATQEASIYHTCRSVLNALTYVKGFEAFLENIEENSASDPLTKLWNICRPGTSLCFLFNTLKPDSPITVNSSATSKSKVYIYHFIIACRDQLYFPEDSLFTVTELCQNDTNGFVKVVNTVKCILELLKEQGTIPEHALTEIETSNNDSPKDMRDNVVYELLSTERKYVQDLEALQNYMKEVQAQEVLSPDTMHYLFGNLNALVDIQRRFLIQIEAQAASPTKEQRFGYLFIQFEEAFTVYEPFCANFQIAQDLVVQVANKLQKLANIMSPTYELPAMLIKPIQRVCKYPLLLQQLIKSTPEDWPYAEENKEGLEAIQRVTKKVNETKRIQENALVVEDLKKKLAVEDGSECSVDKYGQLLLHDKLILQKADSEHVKEVVVFLFEKVILLCKEVKDVNKNSISIKKKRKEGTLLVRGKIPMSRIEHVKGSSAQTGHYVLHVSWTEKDVNQTVQLKCRNDEQLRQWLGVIIEIKESTSKFDLLSTAPQTPLSEINPLLNYYDDEEDDYYNQEHDEDHNHSPMESNNLFMRNRSYSYQYNRMPHHHLQEQITRKQSLGNLSSPNFPPRHFVNGIPGMTLPPLPKSPNTPVASTSTSTSSSSAHADVYLNHSLPSSPPTSHPSSPNNNHMPSGALWKRRQQQKYDPMDESVYDGDRLLTDANSIDLLSATTTAVNTKRNSNSNQDIPEDYIKIKIHHAGSIYVVLVPLTINFDELSKKIEDKLRLCVQEPTISISGLKYEDEDGDLITINSNEDVQMGFEIKGPNNVVNFHVTTVC